MTDPPGLPPDFLLPVTASGSQEELPIAYFSPPPPVDGQVGVDGHGDPPPPTYSVSQPQILVAPLPDSPSFFWGRTVQGEIFVKGLGGRNERTDVKSLTVQLKLDDHLPNQPIVPIIEFPSQTIYPPTSPSTTSNQSTSAPSEVPFAGVYRFNISLPSSGTLPGTLNLSTYNRGEVRWSLVVNLTLSSGSIVTENVPVEGTPQEINPNLISDFIPPITPRSEETTEVEEVLEKDGVRCRMLLDTATPRLGSLLRLGVEVRPMERRKTGVAGLSSQPNPSDTLRPLRRVRVELFRKVILDHPPPTSSSTQAGSSTSGRVTGGNNQYLTLLYTSGKSLRYPGSASTHPPLRVLFTVPTTQLGSVADQTGGEITQFTPYHQIQFFIRATLGFGGGLDLSPTTNDGSPWVIERTIEIRPKIWREPREVVVLNGKIPVSGEGESGGEGEDVDLMSEEEMKKEAYRSKGRDTVGEAGTYRSDAQGDLPPPFSDVAGPSGSTPDGHLPSPSGGEGGERGGDLPTFLESEEQMRSGEAPLPSENVRSERLVPIGFEGQGDIPLTEEDRADWVGRRGNLGGELGTWVEYDGYETFSVAPPSVSASFGVGGVMDPPQEGDEDVNVVGGMMGRLGLAGSGGGASGRELIEQLGLGEGSRVVDLQDDLPPGIDEPSLPALPDFHHHTHRPLPHFTSSPSASHPRHPHDSPTTELPPPSFAASEAAAAAVAGQRRASHSQANLPPTVTTGHGDAPPGYVAAGSPAPSHSGGPPAYS